MSDPYFEYKKLYSAIDSTNADFIKRKELKTWVTKNYPWGNTDLIATLNSMLKDCPNKALLEDTIFNLSNITSIETNHIVLDILLNLLDTATADAKVRYTIRGMILRNVQYGNGNPEAVLCHIIPQAVNQRVRSVLNSMKNTLLRRIEEANKKVTMKTEHLLGKVILAISSTTYSVDEKAEAIEYAISYKDAIRSDVRNSLAILRESLHVGDVRSRIYSCAINHIDSKSAAINCSVNLNNTTDAKEWATQFLVNWQRGMTIDAGTMIGWFANAIETGRTFGRTEAAKVDGLRALSAPIGDILSDPSAERWAKAFCENSSEPVALMHNWFACAISCGINEGLRQAEVNQKIGGLLADYATQKPATDSRPFKGIKTVYAIPQSVYLEKVRKLIQESFMHPLAERMQRHLCSTELQMRNPSMEYLISECAKTTPEDIATQAWLVLGKQWKNVDLDQLEKEVLAAAAADKPIYGVDIPATDSTGYTNGGVKQNVNKIDYTIVPPDFIKALALIMMYGAEKYDRDNWQKVPPAEYIKAAYRHLLAHLGGEFYDKESGLPHLTCVAVDALFAQYNLKPKMPELADVLASAKKAKVKV